MKYHFSIGLLFCCCFVSSAQQIINGSFQKPGATGYIYLHRVGIENLPRAIDSALLLTNKPFRLTIKNNDPGALYKLSWSAENGSTEFPENAFFFTTGEASSYTFTWPSQKELYKANVWRNDTSNRTINQSFLKPLDRYFEIVAGVQSATENERTVLFEKMMAFQKDYIQSIQSLISQTKDRQVLITGLYFLAMIHMGSGEGDFMGYFNTFKDELQESELKQEFEKISAMARVGIDINELLAVPVKNGSTTEKKIAALLGSDYVLIDFWASWCGACRRVNRNELPQLIGEYEADKKFAFLSVSLDLDSNKWQKAVAEDNIKWDNFLISGKEHAIIPGFLKGNGLPFYVLLSKKGDLLFHSGSIAEMKERMKAYQ